jgi:hypothetical protein
VNLVPFAFLLAFRYAVTISNTVWERPALRPLVVTLLVFAHAAPFFIATRRHLDWPNYRQERLMQFAEQLTDPAKDPVYDGIGMVPTRPSVHFNWFLHSLNINQFTDGSGPTVSDMLALRPAAVFIPSYRTDWLPEEDHEFIRERYVPLADDFWVLGKVLPPGGGTFEVFHPGRYRISTLDTSSLLGTYPETLAEIMARPSVQEEEPPLDGILNGDRLPDKPVELPVGTHRIEAESDEEIAVVWVGPRLDRLPELGRGDHRRLFFNWY